MSGYLTVSCVIAHQLPGSGLLLLLRQPFSVEGWLRRLLAAGSVLLLRAAVIVWKKRGAHVLWFLSGGKTKAVSSGSPRTPPGQGNE